MLPILLQCCTLVLSAWTIRLVSPKPPTTKGEPASSPSKSASSPGTVASFFSILGAGTKFGCLAHVRDRRTGQLRNCGQPANIDRAGICYRDLSNTAFTGGPFSRLLKDYATSSLCKSHCESHLDLSVACWQQELEKLLRQHWHIYLEAWWPQHQRYHGDSKAFESDCKLCQLCSDVELPMPGAFPSDGWDLFWEHVWKDVCLPSYTKLYELDVEGTWNYFSKQTPRAARENRDFLTEADRNAPWHGNANFFPFPMIDKTPLESPAGHSLRLTIEKKLDSEEQKPGNIYAYKHPDQAGFIKIGFCATPVARRLNKWRQQCDSEPVLLGSTKIPIQVAQRVEKLIQWHLRALGHGQIERRCVHTESRKCGKYHEEWFEVSMSEAFDVIEFWIDWSGHFQPYGPDHRLIPAVNSEFNNDKLTASALLTRWRQTVPSSSRAGGHPSWSRTTAASEALPVPTSRNAMSPITQTELPETSTNVRRPVMLSTGQRPTLRSDGTNGRAVQEPEPEPEPETPLIELHSRPPITPSPRSTGTSPASSSSSTATINSVGSAITDPGDYEIETPTKRVGRPTRKSGNESGEPVLHGANVLIKK